MTTKLTPQDQERRMAMFLWLDPDAPDSWPCDLLSRLIALEAREGQEALMNELRKLLSPS